MHTPPAAPRARAAGLPDKYRQMVERGTLTNPLFFDGMEAGDVIDAECAARCEGKPPLCGAADEVELADGSKAKVGALASLRNVRAETKTLVCSA